MAALLRSESEELIRVDEDETCSSSSSESQPVDQRVTSVFTFQTPRILSIILMFLGFFTTTLGLLQVYAVPLIVDELSHHFGLLLSNSYGAAIWVGAWAAVTGSVGVRSVRYYSMKTLSVFLLMTIFGLVLNVAFLVFIIVCFPTKATYEEHTCWFLIHLGAVFGVAGSLVCNLATFCQYYEVVLFGDMGVGFDILYCVCCQCCCLFRKKRLFNALRQNESFESPMPV